MFNRSTKFLQICAVMVLGFTVPSVADEADHLSVDVLLSTTQTTIGEPIVYPEGQAKITAAIVTMEPGQSTGWHQHKTPLFAYILGGEITVDYRQHGQKTYREGDTLVDALDSSHNGTNHGDVPVRILVVFSGAESVPNTVSEN